ncbi:MAG: tRNA (adenine(22)-N(1))-methyltransferase [Bacillota bacterium]
MITLSPRLAAVAAHVLDGQVLADIGTDHAYLPAHLVEAGRIPRAIAGDILPGPLDAARVTVAEAGLTGQIELRLGPGLKILQPGEAPCVTICGMGGPLIAEILADGPLDGIRRLVLQPMAGEERLRAWLAENGWRLIAEELVEDAGRLYVILVAEPGAMALADLDLLVGPYLRQKRGRLFTRYVEIQLQQARRALVGAQRSDRPEARERAAELADRIRLLEEVLKP